MMQVRSVDHFIEDYEKSYKKVEQIGLAMDPMSYEDQMEFFKAVAEGKMIDSAISSNIQFRHSLLKKVLNEIK